MIEEFIQRLGQKGFSPSTLGGTRRGLLKYSQWLSGRYSKSVRDATEDHLEAYILRLKETLSWGTVRLYLSHVRKFYRFLHQEGNILKDPTLNLIRLKKERLFPKDIPGESEVASLLNQPDSHTYHGIRDQAILELLYSSGLRNQEVRDLKLGDVDLKESLVRVCCGKGGKGRTVPLGKRASQTLSKYLEVTRPKYAKDPNEDHFFLTERGLALKKWSVNGILYLYRNKSNLTKKLSPHSLRHACALHMLRGGAPLESIRQMLGHTQLATTQIYTQLHPQDLKDAHSRFHPRERQKKILNSSPPPVS